MLACQTGATLISCRFHGGKDLQRKTCPSAKNSGHVSADDIHLLLASIELGHHQETAGGYWMETSADKSKIKMRKQRDAAKLSNWKTETASDDWAPPCCPKIVAVTRINRI